jgi:hypothetical protein
MNKLKLVLIIAFLPNILFGQSYLSEERKSEIKTSERYYWGECSDFKEDAARQCAFSDLSAQVINDAVNQSIKADEILKVIEMGTHFDRLQQKGKKIKILAWIVKDSVFVTIQKPITQTSTASQAVSIAKPSVTKQPATQPQPTPKAEAKPIATGNPILQKLAACKNYKEVKRIATRYGFVRGKINSTEGFSYPEKCIIAVFTADGALSALLDVGDSARTDLLSGQTIQNPEQYYNRNDYFLWYMQQIDKSINNFKKI